MCKGLLRGVASIVLLLGMVTATAAEGDVDATFGHAGVVLFEPDRTGLTMSRPVVQADGRILVCRSGLVGYSPARTVGFVYRLTRDGLPDTGFGNAGRIEFDTSDIHTACGVALQHDGRIIVRTSGSIGSAELDRKRLTRLFRLHADGSPDPGFGAGAGHADLLVDGVASASAMVIQPDDSIVLGLSLETHRFGVARFDKDGVIDESFGVQGFAAVSFPRVMLSFNSVSDVLVDSQNRILVTGSVATDPTGYSLFAAGRWLADGSPDPWFANGGQLLVDLDGADALVQVGFLQDRDRLVMAGHISALGYYRNAGAVRVLVDGRPDASFGINGVGIASPGVGSLAFSGLVKPDGGVVLVGVGGEDVRRAMLLQLDARGRPRADFATGGARSYGGLPDGRGSAYDFTGIALQDPDFIVAGWAGGYGEQQSNILLRIEGAPVHRSTLRGSPLKTGHERVEPPRP